MYYGIFAAVGNGRIYTYTNYSRKCTRVSFGHKEFGVRISEKNRRRILIGLFF